MAEFLVVAGLSGAGRSSTAACLEDLGWFVIDNLPPSIIPKVGELVAAPSDEDQRVALVMGRTGTVDYDALSIAIDQLAEGAHVVRVLFLEAPDDVLVRRFEGTRRRHPHSKGGVNESITHERAALEGIKNRADVILDTGDLNVNQLRARIFELFGDGGEAETMRTTLVSFGFKHGLPLDVDMVFDVRFLPNPHWVEELRDLTGLDAPVRDFVLSQPEATEFTDKLEDLLVPLLPAYAKEGKSYLTIGIGCTGGHHRSVALTEELARRLRMAGFPLSTFHRDIER
jgi:RNase adapter protein RapZ